MLCFRCQHSRSCKPEHFSNNMALFSWVYQLLFGANEKGEPAEVDENSSEESEESSDEEAVTTSQSNKEKLKDQGVIKSGGSAHSKTGKEEVLNSENYVAQILPKNPKRFNKKKKPKVQKKSSGRKKEPIKKKVEAEDKLAYLDRLSHVELMTLCHETERRCKDFWGPVDDLKPLQEKVEKLMYILSSKFSQQEASSGAHTKLQEALKLLEMRVPMIESAAADQESDEEKQESQLYLQVAQVGMRALRLNKQIRCEAPKKRGHINVLIKQFIKCQTDLDALNLDTSGDVHALEASRDVQIFCNEALNSLNQFLEGSI